MTHNKKVLIVVTSHNRMGDTGKPTGYYLPEVTHPYFELSEAGLTIDIASPKGGKAPLDENSRDLSDPQNRKFLEDKNLVSKIENTIPLSEIDPKNYQAVLYAGGHGTMWDFPNTSDIDRISAGIYESGGIVAAVCHGPAALVNTKLSNGKYLVAGKKVSAFSNAEEEAAGLTKVMPFLLESKLKERGALYEKAGLWQEHISVDQRLVTGQNPASAGAVGKAVTQLLIK